MKHYNLDKQPESIQKIANDNKLPWPTFVGQGITKYVGSDAYGMYVVSLSKTKSGKPLVGLVDADTKYTISWTDGHQDCSKDLSKAKANMYITTYGKNKWTGNPKWYYCDETGKRTERRHVNFSWNGAHSYQDPSF